MKSALERVARALCELDGNPPEAKMEAEALWRDYLPEARAALDAIRTPTESMLGVGEVLLNSFAVDADDLEDLWTSMIDEALSEAPN